MKIKVKMRVQIRIFIRITKKKILLKYNNTMVAENKKGEQK
jgi:hypothetical protein